MVQAKKILVRYIPADIIKTQGDYRSVQSYQRRGYDILGNKNGNWILCRSCKVFVTLDCDGTGIYVFNMKRDIVEFYQRDRISEKLVNQFKKDFNEGKIKIYANGNYGAVILREQI